MGAAPRARRLKAPGLLLRVRVGVSHALPETYTTRSAAHRSHGQSYDPVVTAARLRRAHIVGRNIRLARLTAGLSQRELAELVGWHRHQLSDWERGLHEPTVGNLDRVVAVLGHDASWFCGERSA